MLHYYLFQCSHLHLRRMSGQRFHVANKIPIVEERRGWKGDGVIRLIHEDAHLELSINNAILEHFLINIETSLHFTGQFSSMKAYSIVHRNNHLNSSDRMHESELMPSPASRDLCCTRMKLEDLHASVGRFPSEPRIIPLPTPFILFHFTFPFHSSGNHFCKIKALTTGSCIYHLACIYHK